MENKHEQIINEVYSLINSEENLSPYEWVYNKKQYQTIEAALMSPAVDRKSALNQLSRSFFNTYHKRASRLFEVNAPTFVIDNETKSYLACARKVLALLTDEK